MPVSFRHSHRVAPLLLAALLLLMQIALAIHASAHALTPEDQAVCEICLAADAHGAALPTLPASLPVQAFREAVIPLPPRAPLSIVPPSSSARSPPLA